jgi:hypothetical protein
MVTQYSPLDRLTKLRPDYYDGRHSHTNHLSVRILSQ